MVKLKHLTETNNMTVQLSPVDRCIGAASSALFTLLGKPQSKRRYPATSEDSEQLSEGDKIQASRYMRVNHVGEVCAQALYQSQALTARNPEVREKMRHSAEEETDHLAWCEQRLEELGGQKSLLNPVWYAGSFAIGTIAGLAGDRWNLGFVAETEKQVVQHLEKHLGQLPQHDTRSREVVSQMKTDEQQHADLAMAAGASELPAPVKRLMQTASRVMTRTAHWI